VNTLNLIKPYYTRRWKLIVLGLLSLILVDFMQLIIPRIIKRAVDDLTALEIQWQGLLRYALYMAVVGLVIACFRYVWRRCLIGTSRKVEEGLRNRLFSHLQTLSPPFYDTAKTGDLMAHATNDITHIRMAVGMGIVALTDAIVLGTAAIGFMAYINVRLTIYAMIPAPIIVLGTRILGNRMHRLYTRVQSDFSNITETVRERFAGIRITKAHHNEAHETESFKAISENYITSNVQLAKITGAFLPLMLFFSNLSLAAVLYFGGRQTIAGTITPGEFVAFISYLGLLTWPIMAMGWVTNLIQRGKASLDRLEKILNTQPDIADAPDARSVDQLEGDIEIRDISFAYNTHDSKNRNVLSHIDISIEPGQMLGIVGPPGSGKSSLLNLIPRLYDVTEGSISIDGLDIRNLKLTDLRDQIAYAPQEPFLFAGTIGENIHFGKREDTTPELIHAAQEASLHDTVTSFPEGYDTVVGEKGVILSGGQKQRVALARALLSNAPILILDDPVSQVDTQTGNAIISAIRKQAANRRTIIIATHRLSAIKFADRIISLKDGRIVESGTHETLLAAGGYYAKTYGMQEIEEAANAR